MAENVLKLKKRAVELGMDKSDAKTANRSVLEAFISKAEKGTSKKKAEKSAKKSTPAKKKSASKKTTSKKTVKKSADKKSAPAAKKSAKTGKAKRRSTKSDSGRELIGSIDFTMTEGWNPREGSPVARIFKALKKAKGNVDKTVDALMPEIDKLVSKAKPDGTKRTKDEKRALLKYRVNRTKWEFATRTGQHSASENRVQYGTGEYAQSTKKAARKASSVKRATPNTSKKRGRPKSKKTAKK